jgi:hypothetical protein
LRFWPVIAGLRPAHALGGGPQPGEILRQSNANTSATYDRTNKAWDLYIRGDEVVEHVPTGGRGDVDMNSAQRIVESLNQNEGGQVWRVVPMRDY